MKKTLIIIVLLILAAGGLFYWFGIRDGEIQIFKPTPSISPANETAELLKRVGRLIVLPTDEEPTVATVTDPKALQGQEFFLNAKRGDKVIIYVKAKKAILYDPVQDKIVDVAPINLDSSGQ